MTETVSVNREDKTSITGDQQEIINEVIQDFNTFITNLDSILEIYDEQIEILGERNDINDGTSAVPIAGGVTNPDIDKRKNAKDLCLNNCQLYNEIRRQIIITGRSNTEFFRVAKLSQFQDLYYQFVGDKEVLNKNVREFLNNAITHLDTTDDSQFDFVKFCDSVKEAVRFLNIRKQSLELLETILSTAKELIVTPNNAFFIKIGLFNFSGAAYPPVWQTFLDNTVALIKSITELINSIQASKALLKDMVPQSVKEDIQNNTETPKAEVQDKAEQTAEKDPWGIRFTILNPDAFSSINSGSVFDDINNVVERSRDENVTTKLINTITGNNKPTANTDGQSQASEKAEEDSNNPTPNSRLPRISEDNVGLFGNSSTYDFDNNSAVTPFDQYSYYMHLLPAIRSNLPVQGGTDVPGAQPGLNFRIEHSIVKHKVPGFQPIYQPMGVDCIKCTIVGCFTGADGFNTNFEKEQAEILAGLSRKNNNIKDGDLKVPVELWGRGDAFESMLRRSSSLNRFDLLNLNRSYDAFRNAQDFYTTIVAPGKEVEVEINMKKSDAVVGGGLEGPFRDVVSGNPRFKAFIKRMDTYLVRSDRCWYILDLEITDGGLIGDECLNLTNEINESIEALEEAIINEDIAVDDDAYRRCIDAQPNKVVLRSNDQTSRQWVIDINSGYGYIGGVGVNTIDRKISPEQLISDLTNNEGGATDIDEFGGLFNLQSQITVGDNTFVEGDSSLVTTLANRFITNDTRRINKATLVAYILKNGYSNALNDFQSKSLVTSKTNINMSNVFGLEVPGFANALIGYDREHKRFVQLKRNRLSGGLTATDNVVTRNGAKQTWTPKEFFDFVSDLKREKITPQSRDKALASFAEFIADADSIFVPDPSPCDAENIQRREGGVLTSKGVRQTEDGSGNILVDSNAPRFVNLEDCSQDNLRNVQRITRSQRDISETCEVAISNVKAAIERKANDPSFLITALYDYMISARTPNSSVLSLNLKEELSSIPRSTLIDIRNIQLQGSAIRNFSQNYVGYVSTRFRINITPPQLRIFNYGNNQFILEEEFIVRFGISRGTTNSVIGLNLNQISSELVVSSVQIFFSNTASSNSESNTEDESTLQSSLSDIVNPDRLANPLIPSEIFNNTFV